MIDFNTNGRIIDLLYSPMRSLAYLGQYQIMKIIHHQSAPQSRITVYLLSSKFSFRQGDGFLKKPLGPFSWVEFPAGSVRLSVNYFAQLSVNATCEGCEELSAWIRRRGCQQFCILHDVTRFNWEGRAFTAQHSRFFFWSRGYFNRICMVMVHSQLSWASRLAHPRSLVWQHCRTVNKVTAQLVRSLESPFVSGLFPALVGISMPRHF